MIKNAFYVGLFTVLAWGGYQLSYPSKTTKELYYDGLFLENVIKHIDELSQSPRSVGAYGHDDAKRYLINQLKSLGFEVSIQKTTGFNLSNKTAAPVRNIIGFLPGSAANRQTLMMMAHYDAAKFAETGAGDDASGVAVILEAVKNLLRKNNQPENGLMVLFTDAEELGLLGAKSFINEQLGYYDIGLIINFEARGSSGPAMMWPETTMGNQGMITGFQNAQVPLAVSTSLHYEIYKLLPNDTDLTPFNQEAGINGYNFAFIDNHFNYHTINDSLNRLSLNSLAHAMIQANSLLKYYANADLKQVQSKHNLVYFNLPGWGLVAYPVWVSWLLAIIIVVIVILTTIKLNRQGALTAVSAFRSAVVLVLAASVAYFMSWLIIQLFYLWHPEYHDILQGFPYTGHAIMAGALISAALLVCAIYGTKHNQASKTSSFIPLLVGCVGLFTLAYWLPGSSMLFWPLLFASLSLLSQTTQHKIFTALAPVWPVLTFVLIGQVLVNLPIALGITAVPLTAVIVTLFLAMSTAFISRWNSPTTLALTVLTPLVWSAYVINQHPMNADNPHPTSLSYLYDKDLNKAYYYNYDTINTGWNEKLFSNNATTENITTFRNQYHKPVKQLTATPVIQAKGLHIQATKPVGSNAVNRLMIDIKANENTDIMEIYSNEAIELHELSINGRKATFEQPISIQANQKLLQYFFNGEKHLKLTVSINADTDINWQIQSHSADLLEQPEFDLTLRPKHQIPKAFIKTDVITTVQSFSFDFD